MLEPLIPTEVRDKERIDDQSSSIRVHQHGTKDPKKRKIKLHGSLARRDDHKIYVLVDANNGSGCPAITNG